jgi:hypothetical protein
MNSINSFLWILIFRNIGRKDRERFSFVKGTGKSLICGGADDGKLFVTNFPAKNSNFRNLSQPISLLIHTISKFSSPEIPVNISLQHSLILDPSLYHSIKLRIYRFSREFSTKILHAFFHI